MDTTNQHPTEDNSFDQIRKPHLITVREGIATLDLLWSQGNMTDDQRDWGHVTPVMNDGMAPHLHVGGLAVCYLLDPKEYKGITGKIVAVLLDDENFDKGPIHNNSRIDTSTYVIGRMKEINNQHVHLTHDNEAFADVKIDRKQIRQLLHVFYVYGNPVM